MRRYGPMAPGESLGAYNDRRARRADYAKRKAFRLRVLELARKTGKSNRQCAHWLLANNQ